MRYAFLKDPYNLIVNAICHLLILSISCGVILTIKKKLIEFLLIYYVLDIIGEGLYRFDREKKMLFSKLSYK
jgi:hypothetical protein